METTKLREDVPTLEDAFVTCTECMEREFLERLSACELVCSACMEKTLASM